MKCEIIRDLLPSYIDELTSEVSNQEIEEHLKECTGCSQYLKEMKEGVQTPLQIEENRRAIKPFKKVKRSIWKAVGITVLVCALIFGGYIWYYTREWKADSEDVTVRYENVEGVVTMGFFSKNKNTYLEIDCVSQDPDKIIIYEQRINPFHKPLRKGVYYGYTFLDEKTIIKAENGSSKKLTGEEILTIEYGDKTEKIKIKDLYQK